MTGYDVYKKVCSILGYFDLQEGQTPLHSQAMNDIVNQICTDLKLSLIENLSEEISNDKKVCEALIYGTAMLMAAALRDSGCSALYSELYNAKRASVLGAACTRADVLPTAQEVM